MQVSNRRVYGEVFTLTLTSSLRERGFHIRDERG